MLVLKAAVIGGTGLAILLALPVVAETKIETQTKIAPSEAHSNWRRVHRVVILQVTQNDPAVMNMALNNAENLVKYYQDKGDKIEIEFVAYGAGLSMVRIDTSPAREHLTAISASMKNVTFTGCGNTIATQS